MRLCDQEDNDKRADNDQLNVRNDVCGPAEQIHANELQRNWQKHKEGSTSKGAEDRTKAANDDHEQNKKRLLNAKTITCFGCAKIDCKKQRARDANEETRHRKSTQLRFQRAHPYNLRRNIHIADRHPLAPLHPTREITRDNRTDSQKDEAEQIGRPSLGVRTRYRHAKYSALRCVDLTRGRIVVEPADLIKEPDEKELCGKGRNSQIEAFNPKRRQTERSAYNRGNTPRRNHMEKDVHIWKCRHQLIAGIGTHGHKAASPQRNLSAIPCQNVQPNRRNRIDKER